MAGKFINEVMAAYHRVVVKHNDLNYLSSLVRHAHALLGNGTLWHTSNALSLVGRECTCLGRIRAMDAALAPLIEWKYDVTVLADAVFRLRRMRQDVDNILVDCRRAAEQKHLKANGIDVPHEAEQAVEKGRRLQDALDALNADIVQPLDMVAWQLPDAIWALMGCAGMVPAQILNRLDYLVTVIEAWEHPIGEYGRSKHMYDALSVRTSRHGDPGFDVYARKAKNRALWQSRFLEQADEFISLLASVVLTPMAEKEPLVAMRAVRKIVLHFADWIVSLGITYPPGGTPLLLACDVAASVLQDALPWFSTRYPQMWPLIEWFERHMNVSKVIPE